MQNSAFAPHWYSLPRWIWAPLPNNTEEADKIIQSAIQGGFDVTARPAYYRPWASGPRSCAVSSSRWMTSNSSQLEKERALLKQRMAALGFAARSSRRYCLDRTQASAAGRVRSVELAASRLHRAELNKIHHASRLRRHPRAHPAPKSVNGTSDRMPVKTHHPDGYHFKVPKSASTALLLPSSITG